MNNDEDMEDDDSSSSDEDDDIADATDGNAPLLQVLFSFSYLISNIPFLMLTWKIKKQNLFMVR